MATLPPIEHGSKWMQRMDTDQVFNDLIHRPQEFVEWTPDSGFLLNHRGTESTEDECRGIRLRDIGGSVYFLCVLCDSVVRFLKLKHIDNYTITGLESVSV